MNRRAWTLLSWSAFLLIGCGAGGGSAGNEGGSAGAAGEAGSAGVVITAGTGGSGGIIITGGTGGTGPTCTATGDEICDGLDNDCNGKIDDLADWTKVTACGTCDTNCLSIPNVAVPICVAPSKLDGTVPGTCSYDGCATDFWDLNADASDGCEYFCPRNADGSVTQDVAEGGCGVDDDCDGKIDEDLDLCHDAANCGACGHGCDIVGVHATFKCASTAAGGEACTTSNTLCAIDQCEAGYVDANGDPSDGCEYQCTSTGPEICDGLDNDCDHQIDNVDPDVTTGDSRIGVSCSASSVGVCAEPANAGVAKCIAGEIQCCDPGSNSVASTNPSLPATGLRNGVCAATTGAKVVRPGDLQETCNGKDDDCDGEVDDAPVDEGASCGNSVGACRAGVMKCDGGALVCAAAVLPTVEACNGRDDDCDGVTDGSIPNPASPVVCTVDANCINGTKCMVRAAGGKVCATPPPEAVGACAVPTSNPANSPCRAGTLACNAGVVACVGAIGPQGPDTCGQDTNCDGILSNDPDLQTDIHNCGACGNDCTTLYPNAVTSCVAGTCTPSSCRAGRIDCGGTGAAAWDCETLCTKTSNTELCNGLDDDCNCLVDDAIPAANKPTRQQACGVAPDANLTGSCTNVSVACVSGAWKCTYPSGYCTGPDSTNPCLGITDLCDNKDNDCDGSVDEDVPSKGSTCFSDDGLPSQGACRRQGTLICSVSSPNTTATQCSATKDLSKVTAELCDGVDNDCDGSVDELKSMPGASASYVKPALVQVGAATWMMAYEASRPSATSTTSGVGNGWQSTNALAPTSPVPSDLVTCSVSGRLPWFNVTPAEAAQSCGRIGGRLCSSAEWKTACHVSTSTPCKWGYGLNCTAAGLYPSGDPSCNLGEHWAAGTTPALMATGSAALKSCYANWATAGKLYDLTGNLRELTWDQTGASATCNPEDPSDTDCVFRVMGGTFEGTETGATCDFDFYTVDGSFMLYDAGFRCCFDTSDPG